MSENDTIEKIPCNPDAVCATGKTYRDEIPPLTLDSLIRYAATGCPTGDYLRCFMAGDLFEALERADDQNRTAMFPLYCFLRNHLPGACWGTAEKVRDWIDDNEGIRTYCNKYRDYPEYE